MFDVIGDLLEMAHISLTANKTARASTSAAAPPRTTSSSAASPATSSAASAPATATASRSRWTSRSGAASPAAPSKKRCPGARSPRTPSSSRSTPRRRSACPSSPVPRGPRPRRHQVPPPPRPRLELRPRSRRHPRLAWRCHFEPSPSVFSSLLLLSFRALPSGISSAARNLARPHNAARLGDAERDARTQPRRRAQGRALSLRSR